MFALWDRWLQILSEWAGTHPTPPVVPDPPPNPAPIPVTPPRPSDSTGLVAAINAARGSAGLAPLTGDPALERSASSWAVEMASTVGLDHGDFAGRIDAIYPNTEAGENIAEGQPDAAAVVNAWLSDPPHRANLLGPFDRVGGGSALDEAGTVYWCADFVRSG